MGFGIQILEDGKVVDLETSLKDKLRYIFSPKTENGNPIFLNNGDVSIRVNKDFTKMHCGVFPNSFQNNDHISTKLVYIKVEKDKITFSKEKISNIVGSYSYDSFNGFLVFYE